MSITKGKEYEIDGEKYSFSFQNGKLIGATKSPTNNSGRSSGIKLDSPVFQSDAAKENIREAYNETNFGGNTDNYVENFSDVEQSTDVEKSDYFNFQAKKLHSLKLDQFIDYLVTSEEALFEKPHSAIFELAINKMNLNKNDVIMIGDSYDKDIVGAKNAGIRSLHIQP